MIGLHPQILLVVVDSVVNINGEGGGVGGLYMITLTIV